MKEFVPADYVTMVRNPDYWEKDAAGNALPYIDEFRQVTIPEQAAQAAAISSGQIHILWKRLDEHLDAEIEPERAGLEKPRAPATTR